MKRLLFSRRTPYNKQEKGILTLTFYSQTRVLSTNNSQQIPLFIYIPPIHVYRIFIRPNCPLPVCCVMYVCMQCMVCMYV